MKKAYIIEELQKHITKQPFSFHTPGHKGGQTIPSGLKKLWPEEIWKYDLTEIFNLDNLHSPEGCIKEAQKEASQAFGAKSTYFLVNGSSIGLHSAIMALSHQKSIFVPRHVHKAIYNGIILADANPIYLPVSYDERLGIPLGVEPRVLEAYMDKYPDCKTLILPNPTYQGISYKIEAIILLAKKRGLQIIMDEAHGSHFCLHHSLPPSGLSLGADIVIQSWHKTLPTLTQSSVLHLGKDYRGPDISAFINMLQTTSPSYLLLASLDACRFMMEEQGFTLVDETLNKINLFKEEIASLMTLKADYDFKVPFDPLKLCISSNKLSGQELADFLREKYQIYVELAEDNYCLLIAGLGISSAIIRILKKALVEIDKFSKHFPVRQKAETYGFEVIPERIMAPKKAFYANKEEVSLKEAVGRVSGDYIIKYPPGIPLIVPGELINKEVIEILQGSTEKFSKGNIVVVKE